MAIWEDPNILSGTGQQVEAAPSGNIKPELGLCILHQGVVTMEWAARFRILQMPPYIFMMNRNQPYDTGREAITRGVLDRDVKWIFHLDSDLLIPPETIPTMIKWSEEFNLPLLSGLYWAKKPLSMTGGIPMPAAWLKVAEHEKENRIDFQPVDLKPHLGKKSIVNCDVTGAGCMLVNAEVFKKLDKSDPNKPYFQWGLGRKDKDGKPLLQMSEDFYFHTRCVRELGIFPHVCCGIQCDHIATVMKRGSDGVYELMRI